MFIEETVRSKTHRPAAAAKRRLELGMTSTTRQIMKVLLVDDHPIIREGYTQLIEAREGWGICGETGAHQEALELIRSDPPDLAIIDITLEDITGLDLVEDIKAEFPDVKMFVISSHDENLYAERALEAGAMGYINKREAREKLVAGIEQILNDEVFVSEPLMRKLLKRRVGGAEVADGKSRIALLSNRELQVFELVGSGETTQQVANKLMVSPKTVERHKENIKEKLALANATELLQHATRWVLEDR